jgi:hypothetical protein
MTADVVKFPRAAKPQPKLPPKRSASWKGYIYFIESGAAGPIKIGFASSVEQRLMELQTGNPHVLTVLAAIPAMRVNEIDWHLRFAADRIRGEWFQRSEALLAAIAPHMPSAEPADEASGQ